ncbi:MAG: PQQ-binding-like beta-propeller repeat protein [Verrucomicrobia bacterium]|jgi:outer membrane protein assembly factor BamB|nr:PQQ-binding-like beta-propeller repeat protein [Verrucomicrobiota bacterium]MBT7065247.1 PQQ-binding-like beta-propeller repeat protein [Verrucomicrobiota bacterium]
MSRWQVASGKWQVYQAVGMVPGGETRVRWWARPIASAMLLLLLASAASAAPAAAPDWPSHRGDIDRAAEQLEQALLAGYRGDLMGSFGNYRTFGNPSAATEDCARRILALYRMGKLSVHSDAVKRAFVLLFLKAHADPTRHHQAIDLYELIAVPNSDDPVWRMVRARCARRLGLPEMLQLYEQVAKEMTGVPPDDEVRRLWDANRAEFDPDAFALRMRQRFAGSIYGAAALDASGNSPIDGSPFPQLELGALGSAELEWNDVLGESPKTHARALDGMLATAAKGLKLPWENQTGVLGAERALTLHLLAVPPTELAELRAVQEEAFRKTAGAGDTAKPLDLFRRYPWSESAQRKLMESAGQHLFAGETQAAYRCFEDVLRHAATGALRKEAQVGLRISLAQLAEPDVLARPRGPSLASLTPKIVRLPPLRIGDGQSVFSVDMQRDGDRLLVSNPKMLAMYAADNPAKPLWVQKGTGVRAGGAARFAGQRIVTPLEEAYRLVSLRRTDGGISHEGNPNGPRTRYRYRTIGGPVFAGNRAYASQLGQPYSSLYGHQEARAWGYVALSCFGSNLEHVWTRRYERAKTVRNIDMRRGNSARPRVSQGAVFFCSNAGYVFRADCRDGEMEWMHNFNRVDVSQSLWCFGGEPVVTDNTVVCLPKFTGGLFALDKETGRRRWTLTLPRAYEMLGRHGDLVILTAPNTIFAVDAHTGRMRWGSQISPVWSNGFQLPHAQLIGDSVYCGTKKALFRFDARTGAKLESRPWKLGTEAPMSFHIAGSNLYVVSDLPLRDARRERQLVDHHTVILPAGLLEGAAKPIKRKDGSTLIWRDLMLMCIKEKRLLWSRFISNAPAWRSGIREVPGGVALGGSVSATHDIETGQLLQMGKIKIGAKNQ